MDLSWLNLATRSNRSMTRRSTSAPTPAKGALPGTDFRIEGLRLDAEAQLDRETADLEKEMKALEAANAEFEKTGSMSALSELDVDEGIPAPSPLSAFAWTAIFCLIRLRN